jgi:hypothetical protein
MQAKTAGGTALSEYRSKSRLAVVGTKTKPSTITVANLYEGIKSKEGELAAMNFVEFLLVNQPEAEKLVKFATATKPDETGRATELWGALESIEMKADTIDLQWKVWASKAK